MDILKIDPDYDCADTDNRFENLPKGIQDLVKKNAEKAKEIQTDKETESDKE